MFDDLHYLSDTGAFTLVRAGFQVVFMKAKCRALFGIQVPLLKKGTFVKICKTVSVERHGPLAGVVKIEQSLGQLFKIGLISNQFNTGITEERFTQFPTESAQGAFFKGSLRLYTITFGIDCAIR